MSLSRRRFVKTVAAAAAAPVAAVLPRAAAAAAPSNGKTKILLIGHQPDHPHGTHMYLLWCRLLAKCLEQTPNVETVVSDRWPKDPAVAEGIRAIFIYTSPGADILLKGPHAEQVETLLKQGVGLSALHWATNARSRELGERYKPYLGGWWSGRGGHNTTIAKVEQLAKDHPICRGWSDYDLRDEFYLAPDLMPKATPLFKVRVKGRNDPAPKDHVMAWAYERPDGGRAYGNTLGHFHENLGIEPFRKALVNGILWTAGRRIPQAGAPCVLTRRDMLLPPPSKKAKKKG